MKTPEHTSARIVMLSTPGCGDCLTSQMKLDFHNIPYLKLDLSDDAELTIFLSIVSRGKNLVPLIFFFAEDVTEEDFRNGISASPDAAPTAKISDYTFEPNVFQLNALLTEFGFLPRK